MNSWQFRVEDNTGFATNGVPDELLELVELILSIIDNFYSLIAVFRRFRARNISTGEATLLLELENPHPGLLAGDAAPAGVGYLFAFRTLQKKAILKKFFSPVSTNTFDPEGQIDTTGLSNAATALAQFLAPLNTTLGSFTYGYQSPVSLTFLVPTSGYAPAEPAYQRRRRLGTGS